ncbi:molybdopterin-synthase adenylyltransferase MoeB [Lysobacter sp. TY2-98]|uniref:molybdopterin-synthase adenylyltransferase MoeB n=1 Tax=Lysobacter sp. TY2-98 TaxID=2290922 RepID=UPI000E203743|nr:molybdopterin-synthase adenylyltransferase MoeB [Lysobacter sp. TY2-98]AXK71728.1 molybdopterin-synthase adenylyltransferase MoeB [Lysobacter sp. TY2-98]
MIPTIAPTEALERQRAGAVLVDVRERHERASGMATGAIACAAADIASTFTDRAREIGVICESGMRSANAAAMLLDLGYARVFSVDGGTRRWRTDGLPVVQPEGDADFFDRYSRHLRLPEVGIDGQERLQRARVLVIGAGGLGSPAAYYLAAAGIGTLRIADDDVVDRSNLQRQILHTDARVGVPKVASASATLRALNPRLRIEAEQVRVTSDNVDALLDGVDVVLDGADNFPVRYLLNDACVRHAKPLVYGAVHRFDGQLSVFDAGRHRGECPCYRCLFPEPPPAEAAPNCAEAGVLGVLPGVVGLLQATEVIKLLLGIGEPLAGRLLHFDALGMRFRETRLRPDPDCPVCAPGRPFAGYIDYAQFCAG